MHELLVNCRDKSVRVYYTRLVNSISEKFFVFSVYPDDLETTAHLGEFKTFTFSSGRTVNISWDGSQECELSQSIAKALSEKEPLWKER